MEKRKRAIIPIKESKAEQSHISREEQEQLLDEIRTGNEAAIPVLIKGMEAYIREAIARLAADYPDSDELFQAARTALTRLAAKELNNKSKEQFDRFSAWWVHQAIFQIKNKKR